MKSFHPVSPPAISRKRTEDPDFEEAPTGLPPETVCTDNEEGSVSFPRRLRICAKSFAAGRHRRSVAKLDVPASPHKTRTKVVPASPVRTRCRNSPGFRGIEDSSNNAKGDNTSLVIHISGGSPTRNQSVVLESRARSGGVLISDILRTVQCTPCASPAKRHRRREGKRGGVQTQLRLFTFWERKKELEDKYRTLLADLALEEASELGFIVDKTVVRAAHSLEYQIREIKDYYSSVKSLIEQQKIVEEDALINEYRARVSEDGQV